MQYTHSMKMAIKSLEDAINEATQDDRDDPEYSLIMTHVNALDDLMGYLASKSEELEE